MRKVFIELMAVMREVDENPQDNAVYEKTDNCRVFSDTPVWFPITAVMESTIADRGNNEYMLITVGTDSEQSLHNNDVLDKEMSAHGFHPTVSRVCVSQEQSSSMSENLITQLISLIRPGDDLYVSMTYGTKPMMISLLYAIQIIATGIEDVEIQGLFYGEKSFQNTPPRFRIYDNSYLFYLGQMIGDIEPGDETQLNDMVKNLFSLSKTQ